MHITNIPNKRAQGSRLRAQGQLTPSLYQFLGKQSIDPTDIPQFEDLQAGLVLVLMENGVMKYGSKSGATQSLIKSPICSTDLNIVVALRVY